MPAETTRAVVVTEPGDAGVLRVRDVPVPSVGAGQLLVRVAASGVNFIDVYRRQGVYPVPTPFVLGGECAGTVLAVGPGVDGFAVGDVVATAAGANGTHAEVALLDAATTVPVPDGVDPELAAAAILQGMTAHYLVHATYPVAEGETALVHAAAGGTGALVVQMCKAQGARVIATVGSAAKVRVAREAGADEVIRYDELPDTGAALTEAVRGFEPDGVHVAYDGVGRATFDASLGSLRRRGMLVLFGGASGQVPPVDPQRLNAAGSLFLTRPTLVDYVATRDELLQRSGDVFAAIAEGALHVAVGGRYALDDAARAYGDLEGRATTGKLLFIP
ncbi:quinone oxidoreductase [Jatrophihabitans endophyticus]|uniref:quinone oxidoreductase family protein n=1 Tax=Jatrophihabitans endophyticus TaxID=1206085 RepID=UPI001A1060F6|nr:quinone oxidoreductase [Jatrophihabitans endophyticus]MBE7187393.1 quinone oxidoreductase [Jatrophihabitans endophyticus]